MFTTSIVLFTIYYNYVIIYYTPRILLNISNIFMEVKYFKTRIKLILIET